MIVKIITPIEVRNILRHLAKLVGHVRNEHDPIVAMPVKTHGIISLAILLHAKIFLSRKEDYFGRCFFKFWHFSNHWFHFLYSPNSEIVVRIRLGFIFCIIQIIVSAVLLLLHSCRTTRMWSHTLLAHLNHLSQFVARSNYFPFFDVGGRLIWNVSQEFIWSSTDQEVSNIEYQ